jgi:two-component system chemotaxis response regulator CheB
MTTNLSEQDAGSKRTRVLIVDDSAVQRDILTALLSTDQRLYVIATASSGEEAVRAAARLKPDVILMDMRMPGLDGVQATSRIMQETPTPIVMVTYGASREDQVLATAAFEAGVVAFLPKPPAGPAGNQAAQELRRTVRSMAGVKVIRRRAVGRRLEPTAGGLIRSSQRPTRVPRVIAMGASTGGPQVLREILVCLPADFPVPVLVVQHIASGFVTSMVEWLKSQCSVPVQVAVPGKVVAAPGIYIAPTDQHMIVHSQAIVLTDDPPVGGHRPSVDVLFESVAAEYGADAVGVLLTGMGRDGAAGLCKIRRSGSISIAQDEASSVVFGMPRAGIEMGGAEHVLPPHSIASLLLNLSSSK